MISCGGAQVIETILEKSAQRSSHQLGYILLRLHVKVKVFDFVKCYEKVIESWQLQLISH